MSLITEKNNINSEEHILVCLSAAPSNKKIIDTATKMAEGILAVTVFCMFGLGFYIANKADQFWGEIQENMEEKQQSSKTLFLNTLSDEELLREIHECKIEYKEAEIIIFDGQSGYEKKNFDHNTVA